MTAFERYRKIQAFKTSQTAAIDGVNYAHVIASYLYDFSLLGWIKKLIFSLFFRITVIKEKDEGESILLFYSCRNKLRADYDYIPLRLQQILGELCTYAESGQRMSLLQAPRTLVRLPSSLIATRGFKASLFQRIGAALLIAKYRTAEEDLVKLLNGKNCLVTFCDAQPLENLLTQIARTRNLFTCTNQHGQYRVLNETNMSPDAEAYTNFVSDRLLCWGEATRCEFVKAGISEDQLSVTGWLRKWSAPPTGWSVSRQSVFGVMLNGKNGKSSNARLIKAANTIALRCGLRYIVRLHPWSKATEYQHLVTDNCIAIDKFSLPDYLLRVDFSIGHMSGAVIEMLHSRSLVYLLDDGYLADVFIKEGLSFSNVESMVNAIELDMSLPDKGHSRLFELGRWYNDDCDQAQRVRTAIINK